METLHLTELQPSEILDYLAVRNSDLFKAMEQSRERVPWIKREINEYQAALIYCLAKRFNCKGANILEIGTAWGRSASLMALAAPLANVITLNPKEHEVKKASVHLKTFPNVTIEQFISWDYLDTYDGPELDMVFIDGDHKRVKRDFPWWNWLKVGGLKLHHDYSPNESSRPCPPVYDACNEFIDFLGRDSDILVVDNENVGMIGFVKREDDPDWIGA